MTSDHSSFFLFRLWLCIVLCVLYCIVLCRVVLYCVILHYTCVLSFFLVSCCCLLDAVVSASPRKDNAQHEDTVLCILGPKGMKFMPEVHAVLHDSCPSFCPDLGGRRPAAARLRGASGSAVVDQRGVRV